MTWFTQARPNSLVAYSNVTILVSLTLVGSVVTLVDSLDVSVTLVDSLALVGFLDVPVTLVGSSGNLRPRPPVFPIRGEIRGLHAFRKLITRSL